MFKEKQVGSILIEKSSCVGGVCVKLTIILAVVALGCVAALRSAAPAMAVSNCDAAASIDSEEEEFLRLINEHRQGNGLAALELSDSLSRSAAWKSQDMAAEGYLAHDDARVGRTWVERLRDCGYTFDTWLGENIAGGNETAAAAFEQWRTSPGHNANMLNSDYTAIGIGRAYASSSPYRWYWTTDFGGVADGHAEATGPAELTDDAGCDGVVNSIDAALILQRDAGLITSPTCLDAGDVNGDGMINAIDAALILQYDAGLIGSLPS